MPSTEPSEHRPTAFLAGPFKSLVDPRTSRMWPEDVRRFEALIGVLEDAGYRVHNAHRREAWGEQFLTPEACTEADYQEIAGCALFVALPGQPPSPGTHVEIGWASALGRPIVLLLEEDQEYAFLVRGLHVVADVSTVDAATNKGMVEGLRSALIDLRAPGEPT